MLTAVLIVLSECRDLHISQQKKTNTNALLHSSHFHVSDSNYCKMANITPFNF